MKYIALLLSISSLPCFAMDGSYQLPSTKTIIERLNKAELKEFARESKMANTLGDAFFRPIALHTQVTFMVEEYNQRRPTWNYQDYKKGLYDSKSPTVSIIMNLLLQDHPRALTALTKNYDGAFLR